MFEKLPSLRRFQPKFYSGGLSRFHLPLLYDLVGETKPKRVVVLGFGDGQAFFTFCQAAGEQKVDCECVAVRRDRVGEAENEDADWKNGRADAKEFYGESARFFTTPEKALAAVADGGVDILWLNDSDSGEEIQNDYPDGRASSRRMRWSCFMGWRWNGRTVLEWPGRNGWENDRPRF